MIAFLLLLATLLAGFCGGVSLYLAVDWADCWPRLAAVYGVATLLLFALSLWCGLTAIARIFGVGLC